MRVNKVSSFSRAHLHREIPEFPVPPVYRLEMVEKDGCFVQDVVECKKKQIDDMRDHFTVNDFSLSTVIANDGVKALKEVRLEGDLLDNADRVDDTLACVDSLRESVVAMHSAESAEQETND